MIVNFETTKTKKSFINIQINNIKKDTTLDDNETFYSSDNIEEYSNEQELSNNLLVPKQNKITILQDMLISSLDYLSNQRLLIQTLPEEINIKFTNTSFTDKIKSIFSKNELAEVNLNSNTIYISADLLSNNPKDQFLQEFSHKFQDKQSLIDAFFYHEFAHVIFKNTFNNVFNIYSKLTDNYPEINNKQFSNTPLYQILRNLEENFADSFSAFIHKNKLKVFSVPKNNLYVHLKKVYNINWKNYLCKRINGDEVIINNHSKDVFVIEKKSQKCNGSVDDKIQTYLVTNISTLSSFLDSELALIIFFLLISCIFTLDILCNSFTKISDL